MTRCPWIALVLLGALPALAQEALPPTVPPAPDAPLRRFQQDDYLLAYEVFVGNGELESALRVAQQAVRARPGDASWRRRLAQVAEWLARTDIAAEQWRALFALGDRSQTTIDALLRLSNALEDPLAALPAWVHLARQQPLSAAQWNQVYWLFEDASEPARGSRFFEAQYRDHGQPLLLELAARLALNGGDDLRALRLYRERAAAEPFSTDALLQAVYIELRRDRHDDALLLMRGQMARVPDSETDFWRLLGQLAWEAGDYTTSQAAYARGIDSQRSEPGDWSRLVFLTRQTQPLRAAELALIAWRRHGAIDMLLQALEIYADLGELHAQGRVYQELDAAQRARAERSLTFLLGRAQYHQRRQQPRQAWADLQRALQLAPNDDNTVIAALWFLADAGWPDELGRMLARYEGRARTQPIYWQPYAAGQLALGRTNEAAGWYRRALERSPADPVVLSAYADVLDEMRQTGMADRLRRHAWLLLEDLRAGNSHLGELMRRPEFQTWVRLRLSRYPGRAALALQRGLQQQWRDPKADPSARDGLVLNWVLDRELPDSARRWMLERYTRLGRSAPVSAQARLALMQMDQPHIAALLQDGGRGLATSTRVELATAAGRSALAIDTAFQGLGREPASDVLHEPLRQQLPRQAHYVQWNARQDSYGPLDRLGHELEARRVLSPQLHLLAAASQTRQSSSDPDFAPLVPATEDRQRVELRWLGRDSETRLAMTEHQALQHYRGVRVQQQGRWSARLTYEFDLRYQNASELTLPMRVAGHEDSLLAALGYALDRRTTLRAAPQFTRYHTQYGDALGSGAAIAVDVTHHLRSDYPDLYLRAYTDNRGYQRDGSLSAQTIAQLPAAVQAGLADGSIDPIGYFLPRDSSTLGLCAGVGGNLSGLSLPEDYSRAWRPYGNGCLTDNSVLGQGYLASVGAAGPVVGHDHLRLEWQRSEATTPGGTSINTLSIRYRHYF